ncbi:hypothetical protein JOF45_000856 [Nesterenkonia lacusekhoensis]|uniref:ATP/GTP-binding protein n=1 Tax=Nesterenkonia lacusekhoensis TaxID=150832 RepID=A0ABS4T064_9MICC|nr:hypothetical protein [Nesterenkonia lacusekhoensis]
MGKGRRGSSKWQREHRPLSAGTFAPGGISAGTVKRRGREYHVRWISAAAAQKSYTCPGCHLEIPPAVPHVVVWPADSLFGDEYAAGERRHWHRHCWKIA